jgi:hypothetical protein
MGRSEYRKAGAVFGIGNCERDGYGVQTGNLGAEPVEQVALLDPPRVAPGVWFATDGDVYRLHQSRPGRLVGVFFETGLKDCLISISCNEQQATSNKNQNPRI